MTGTTHGATHGKRQGLSFRWKVFLLFSLAAGLALRLLFLEDMEFKEDEHYNFIQAQLVGRTEPWPWIGMPSGVFIPNPGMSVWVFAWLARIAGLLGGGADPVSLQRALGILSVAGIALLVPFALRFAERRDREACLWAFALALVNPIHVYIQRKLWPEPFFMLFSMLFLMGWWRRDRFTGALVWGFVGAWLGQIHMSGFFYAFAFFAWTLFEEWRAGRTPRTDEASRSPRASWRGWLLGSLLGALPLIPWLHWIATQGLNVPSHQRVSSGLSEALQLKFWVFWLTDPLGLHLGNPLGILRGNSHLAQLSDFLRYPLVGGRATYLNAAAHVALVVAGARIFLPSAWRFLVSRPRARSLLPRTELGRALFAAGAGFGAVMTVTGVMIRRYYMMVSFPFELLALTRASETLPRRRVWLAVLFLAQLFVSACFVGYVHVNEGSPQGDYGHAFHKVRDENLRTTGKPWAERPPSYY